MKIDPSTFIRTARTKSYITHITVYHTPTQPTIVLCADPDSDEAQGVFSTLALYSMDDHVSATERTYLFDGAGIIWRWNNA